MDKVLVLNQVEVEGDLMSQGMKGILWNEPSIDRYCLFFLGIVLILLIVDESFVIDLLEDDGREVYRRRRKSCTEQHTIQPSLSPSSQF